MTITVSDFRTSNLDTMNNEGWELFGEFESEDLETGMLEAMETHQHNPRVQTALTSFRCLTTKQTRWAIWVR